MWNNLLLPKVEPVSKHLRLRQQRIYVSGTSSADPLQGVVERSDDGGHTWKRTTVQLPRGSGSLFISGIHPNDPDRLWFRVPGRGDIFGVDPTRLWLSTDGAVTFQPLVQTEAGMLGFAVSPDGTQIAFGGPRDGLFVAPADSSAAAVKVADLQVRCLRWSPSGLYVCAGEPVDPYSLGHAKDPMEGFVPLWHRANTCQGACSAPSTLEEICSAPWEMIAPLVGADNAVCEASAAVSDAGTDAGASASDAGIDAGAAVARPARDSGSDGVVDASLTPPRPSSPASSSGCAATPRPFGRTPPWLAVGLLVVFGLRRRTARA